MGQAQTGPSRWGARSLRSLRPPYPRDALAERASRRWRGRAEAWLWFADEVLGTREPLLTTGMLVRALLCEAHSRMCEQRKWVLNEKRLLDRAGLGDVALTPDAVRAAITAR